MKLFPVTALALALAVAFPAQAQSNADILKELQALKDKVAELENKLKAQDAKLPPAAGQWGMTADQARELSRATLKAEATEDALESQGLKQLSISGFRPCDSWASSVASAFSVARLSSRAWSAVMPHWPAAGGSLASWALSLFSRSDRKSVV